MLICSGSSLPRTTRFLSISFHPGDFGCSI
jgi:hypothetical protein